MTKQYTYHMTIYLGKLEVFKKDLKTPNRQVVQSQLQPIEDGKRTPDGSGEYYFEDSDAQLALSVLIATCWQSIDEKEAALVNWLSCCPHGLAVDVSFHGGVSNLFNEVLDK